MNNEIYIQMKNLEKRNDDLEDILYRVHKGLVRTFGWMDSVDECFMELDGLEGFTDEIGKYRTERSLLVKNLKLLESIYDSRMKDDLLRELKQLHPDHSELQITTRLDVLGFYTNLIKDQFKNKEK